MEKGTIANWVAKEGSTVNPGDIIASIETDKAAVDYESTDEYIMVKHLYPAGTSDIDVNEVIAIAVDDQDELEEAKAMDFTQFTTKTKQPETKLEPPKMNVDKIKVESTKTTPTPSETMDKKRPNAKKEKVIISPSAQQIFRENKIMYKTAFSHKFINKADALNMIIEMNLAKGSGINQPIQSQPDQPIAGAYTSIPTSTLRKVISQRLTESKTQIPHQYSKGKASISSLMAHRKDVMNTSGKKFSLNDVLIKAVAMALQLNKSIISEGLNTSDISVAVASKNGLITPIVPQAESKDVFEISSKMKELVGKAQSGTLATKEFQGGSFTISNLGMFGVHSFSAIINPPQKAILALGGPEKMVEVSKDGKPYVNTYLNYTLSYDGNQLSEYETSKFLESLEMLISNPKFLL